MLFLQKRKVKEEYLYSGKEDTPLNVSPGDKNAPERANADGAAVIKRQEFLKGADDGSPGNANVQKNFENAGDVGSVKSAGAKKNAKAIDGEKSATSAGKKKTSEDVDGSRSAKGSKVQNDFKPQKDAIPLLDVPKEGPPVAQPVAQEGKPQKVAIPVLDVPKEEPLVAQPQLVAQEGKPGVSMIKSSIEKPSQDMKGMHSLLINYQVVCFLIDVNASFEDLICRGTSNISSSRRSRIQISDVSIVKSRLVLIAEHEEYVFCLHHRSECQ